MRKIIFYTIIVLFTTACNNKVEIANNDLSLHVNADMQIQIESKDSAIASFYSGFYASDELIADEFTANQFAFEKVSKNKDEIGTSFLLQGNYSRDGFSIEKYQKITIPADFPDMLIFETYYINKGSKQATVQGWVNTKIRVQPTDGDSLWTFQPTSTNLRKDWIFPIKEGFYQQNYLGMNNSDYGGGIPMVDIWRRNGGVSIGVAENTLKLVSMPVKWIKYEDYATLGIQKIFDAPENFAQNDTIKTYKTFVTLHKGDYFNSLREFTKYMEAFEGYHLPKSDPGAFDPVWCAWGYERTFTMNEIINTLPKVKELGFKWVDVDDGYQIAEGDWDLNSRFPKGDKEMRMLTDKIHEFGLKAKLWWAPLAADPGTKVLKEHPQMLLQTKEYIPEYISWWDSYYLSPVNPVTQTYTDELLHKFLVTWNFDGLKMDGQHLNCCLPDYNPASELKYPEESVERLPEFFKNIYQVANEYKPHAILQNCPCGCAVNFFNIQYMNQAVASDPTSSWQIRLKAKTYHAIAPDLAYYGDHIELSNNYDFASQIGVGAVIGSKFTYPKNNPDVKEDYTLTPAKEVLYKKWVDIYSGKMLSQGKYLNLYDIGYDKPEAHVIQKGDTLYYAFYAKSWKGEPIMLKGLSNKEYTVCEYTTDSKRQYKINGSKPVITPVFEGNYLIEVY